MGSRPRCARGLPPFRPSRRVPGSHALLSLLVDDGMIHLFGNPGTTELSLMAALPYPWQIECHAR